ncbi:TIGR03086 family metal-binding protein [Amycolatopsis sp. DSM 110486]|uniref:TIGR03086 family metal-binding protein n=1 Tax=Amycolatopsis sp. DSM 110486 TaxID=2865832 RepID=UPI001C697B6A|nr:TIGR03086 family metal-binding protein [Amycolatopsis sp. DSM 110486]QYN25637.1 TIGR03086 family protein [Amycolatopsis sp. DSM 110486]
MSGPLVRPGGEERSVLGSAARYLLRSVLLARDADLSARTPCPDWNLGDLLRHVRASLEDLTGVLIASEPPYARGPEPDAEPVAAIRARLVDLVVAWAFVLPGDRWCEVGDRRVQAEIVVYTAATEMVVHGWDISQSCGAQHLIPAELARSLLAVSRPLVEAGAGVRAFATSLSSPATATPGERLLALFGRSPDSR